MLTFQNTNIILEVQITCIKSKLKYRNAFRVICKDYQI